MSNCLCGSCTCKTDTYDPYGVCDNCQHGVHGEQPKKGYFKRYGVKNSWSVKH